MDFIPEYIENKHNPQNIKYITPQLKPILDDTYGEIIYQEQVMKIVQVLGGFSAGRADLVRKAMGYVYSPWIIEMLSFERSKNGEG